MIGKIRVVEVPPHPMQPVYYATDGVIRFRENKIVRFLQEWAGQHGMDMNTLAMMPFDDDDRRQFAQLIGYSVSGYGELPYTEGDESVRAADAIVEESTKRGKS